MYKVFIKKDQKRLRIRIRKDDFGGECASSPENEEFMEHCAFLL